MADIGAIGASALLIGGGDFVSPELHLLRWIAQIGAGVLATPRRDRWQLGRATAYGTWALLASTAGAVAGIGATVHAWTSWVFDVPRPPWSPGGGDLDFIVSALTVLTAAYLFVFLAAIYPAWRWIAPRAVDRGRRT